VEGGDSHGAPRATCHSAMIPGRHPRLSVRNRAQRVCLTRGVSHRTGGPVPLPAAGRPPPGAAAERVHKGREERKKRMRKARARRQAGCLAPMLLLILVICESTVGLLDGWRLVWARSTRAAGCASRTRSPTPSGCRAPSSPSRSTALTRCARPPRPAPPLALWQQACPWPARSTDVL
jgi:hypothetical protein